jgi:NTP pyrophosphatase (non-canonical NTP hydrolase)
MRETQRQVATFLDEADLHAPPAYRLIDLTAEVGEVAADAAKSSGYGADPEALSVSRDELGDVLFAALALADELDVDAEAALAESLAKYEARLDADGTAGSSE